MPPHSKLLAEEGATFKSFKLVQNGVFDEKGKLTYCDVNMYSRCTYSPPPPQCFCSDLSVVFERIGLKSGLLRPLHFYPSASTMQEMPLQRPKIIKLPPPAQKNSGGATDDSA